MISIFICLFGFSQKDGKLDKKFGKKGITITDINCDNDYTKSIAIQEDGKIVLAGFTDNGVNEDFAVCRFNLDGSIDTSFGNKGKIITPIGGDYDIANSVKIQSTGKIIVAGYIGNEVKEDFTLVRYNNDGILDSSFGKNGISVTSIGKYLDVILGIQILTDDKIIAAGKTFDGKKYSFAMAKFLKNGHVDTQFGDSGIVVSDILNSDAIANSVVIQNDGKIILGGDIRNGIYSDFAMVRYFPDGFIDESFGKNGVVVTSISEQNDNLTSILVQPDGKIISSGHVFNKEFSNFAAVRYLMDGKIDSTFGNKGIVINDEKGSIEIVNSSLLQDDGKVILIGNLTTDTITNIKAIRYTNQGKLDKTFGRGGKIISKVSKNYRCNYAYAAALQKDGNILIAGNSRRETYTDLTILRLLCKKENLY
ncbi:MAG: hypothetical protein HY951_10800 [Bacteroidia bacterium]|nr:hypothetical protein [Bacteroidia bacterium]